MMRGNRRSMYFISGCVCFLAGVVLLILRQSWAVILFLLGLGLLGAGFSLMLKTGGYSGERMFTNGLGGQGRQISEADKLPKSQTGEQSSSVWDAMTEKKE